MYISTHMCVVWFAVVFGINSASNAGRKIVIVWGAAEYYYTFHSCIASTINPNTTAVQINLWMLAKQDNGYVLFFIYFMVAAI